jgi:hypothetical protein
MNERQEAEATGCWNRGPKLWVRDRKVAADRELAKAQRWARDAREVAKEAIAAAEAADRWVAKAEAEAEAVNQAVRELFGS